MKTDPGEMEYDNCLLKVRFQETGKHPSNSILGVPGLLITFTFQMHNYEYYFDIRKLTFPSIGFFFLIRFLGGGVQLGPLGTAATDWPIVACPG
jgi:hypothetical protein